jgi:hypothetical protein
VIVGLISGVVGLLFLLFPGIRPESPSAGRDRSASLTGLKLEPTTRGHYLDYADLRKSGLTKGQLDQQGAMATFKVTLVGYKGKSLPLQRQLVDVDSGDVIGETRDFTLEPNSDAENGMPFWDWVPLRPGRGSYVMVFKLFADPNAPAVECKQTRVFGGLAGRTAGSPGSLCPA